MKKVAFWLVARSEYGSPRQTEIKNSCKDLRKTTITLLLLSWWMQEHVLSNKKVVPWFSGLFLSLNWFGKSTFRQVYPASSWFVRRRRTNQPLAGYDRSDTCLQQLRKITSQHNGGLLFFLASLPLREASHYSYMEYKSWRIVAFRHIRNITMVWQHLFVAVCVTISCDVMIRGRMPS